MTVSGIKALNGGGTWNGNTYTYNNTTFTILTDSDGNVTGINIKTGSGGSSGQIQFILANDITLPSGNYVLNGCPSGGSASTYLIGWRKNSVWQTPNDTGSGASITVDSSDSLQYQITINTSGVVVDNKTFYPMIRISSVADATFEPWENKCSISGRASTSVSTTDGEDTESVTIIFGTTVYGGTVNFNTGVLTIDMVIADMGSLSWTYDGGIFRTTLSGSKMPPTINTKANILSEIYETDTSNNVNAKTTDGTIALHTVNNLLWVYDSRYTDPTVYTAAINGVQLCYELETPITLTLTPDELTMLKGYNSVTGDGVITITVLTGNAWGGDS